MHGQPLLAAIEAFQAEFDNMADSTFGRLAMNDWKFISRIRANPGRLLVVTDEKVRSFMADYRATKANCATETAASRGSTNDLCQSEVSA